MMNPPLTQLKGTIPSLFSCPSTTASTTHPPPPPPPNPTPPPPPPRPCCPQFSQMLITVCFSSGQTSPRVDGGDGVMIFSRCVCDVFACVGARLALSAAKTMCVPTHWQTDKPAPRPTSGPSRQTIKQPASQSGNQ